MTGKLQKAFEIYKTYLGVKLHFTVGSNYNYSAKRGYTKTSPEAFEKRKDKYSFISLASKIQPAEAIGFFAANTIGHNELPWIRNLLSEESMRTYEEWRGRISSIEYHFQKDVALLIRTLGSNPMDWFVVPKDSLYPPIVSMVQSNEITIETYAILVKIFDAYPLLQKSVTDTIIWPKWSYMAYKYGMFLNVPLQDIAKKLRKQLQE